MGDAHSYIKNREVTIRMAIEGLINEKNFVNLCVIKKVHNDDFCDVSMYNTGKSGAEVVITDVRILHLGTAHCRVVTEPVVGDYVLLLTPKDFVEKMEFNREVSEAEAAYEPYADCNACGVLVKAEGEDEVNVSLFVDKDGNITLDSDGKFSATIGKDEDDVVINVSTEDGTTLSDQNNNEVKINKDGVSFKTDGKVDVEAAKDGLLTLKNSVDSLGNIVSTFIDIVNTFSQNVQSIDTVGSPASHSAGPGIIANMIQLQTKLEQLKQTAGKVLG